MTTCDNNDACKNNEYCNLTARAGTCITCADQLDDCNCGTIKNCQQCDTTDPLQYTHEAPKCQKCLGNILGDDCSCNAQIDNCAFCNAAGDSCLTCKPAFYLTDGKGIQSGKKICSACSERCLECLSARTCSKCEDGNYLFSGKMCLECVDVNTINCFCDGTINGNCTTCGDIAGTCGSCTRGKILALDGQCGYVENCEELTTSTTCLLCYNGNFLSADATKCTKCDQNTTIACTCGGTTFGNCQTCGRIGIQCKDCIDDIAPDSVTRLCVKNCSENADCDVGKYCAVSTCQPCGYGLSCKTCSGITSCDTCYDSSELADIEFGGRKCGPCSAGTRYCFCGDIKNCSYCEFGETEASFCLKCGGNFTGDNCDGCKQGFGGDDCEDCAVGYYAVVFKGLKTCVKCKEICASCSDGISCDSCRPDLTGFDCSCKVIETIDKNCLNCVQGGEICKECAGNFDPVDIAVGVTCDTCKPEFAGFDCSCKVSETAGKNCSTCVQGGDICQKCTANFEPVSIIGGVTCDMCISGFVGEKCDKCDINFFQNAEKCDECKEGITEYCNCGEIQNCVECPVTGTWVEIKCKTCLEGFEGTENGDCTKIEDIIDEDTVVKQEKKGISGGAIAGITIGVVIVVFFVARGLYFYMKKIKDGQTISRHVIRYGPQQRKSYLNDM